jgi:hypothetical protein
LKVVSKKSEHQAGRADLESGDWLIMRKIGW